ncbi:MAG: M10 family metallopeptidase C-terminal domain-containing protein [bacterium]
MPTTALSLPDIINQLQTQWGGDSEGTKRDWQSSSVSYNIINLTPMPGSIVPELVGGTTMSADQIKFATEAFELWDDLIAISLDPTTSTTPNISLAYSSTTTNGGLYTSPNVFPLLGGHYAIISENIWMNSMNASMAPGAITYGAYGFEVFLHEIGHALGLSHPGSYDASDPVAPTYATNAEYLQDTRKYTVMSYFQPDTVDASVTRIGVDGNYANVSTPMLHDILAIQAKYGADYTTRATDTTYGFHSTADRDVYNFNLNPDPVMAIWDGGGIDTLDCSGFGADQSIDLIAGHYSNVGGMTYNIAIAYNCVIENAVGGSGNDVLQGNVANNMMDGGKGSDTFAGGGGNDTLTGSADDDFIYGNNGDDLLIGGAGADLMYGGDGYDTVAYLATAGEIVTITSTGAPKLGLWEVTGPKQSTGDSLATIEGFQFGNGNDMVTLVNAPGSRVVTINGSGGNDTIIGSGGPEVMIGGSGTDLFTPLRGVFTVFGGKVGLLGDWVESVADHDTLEIDRHKDASGYTFLLTGVQTVGSWIGSDGSTARGIARIDFTGTNFLDQVTGGLWNDNLVGGGGDDVFHGRDGNDELYGGDGNDILFAEDGNDVLDGGDGADSIYGGIGNDIIRGGLGVDLIYGGEGNDKIDAGGGGDPASFGDKGNDTLTGTDDIEQLYGGDDNDRLIGNGGNDSLFGGLGNDQIFGGSGDDFVDPGLGVERLDGGLGINRLNMDRSTTSQGVSFFLNGPVGSDGSSATNFDWMIYKGGTGNDTVVGSDGNDVLYGGFSADVLDGQNGADFIDGGFGDDVLSGGLGMDTLFGGDGNDRLETGGGGDLAIYGGAGNDTLNGSADAESLYGGNDDDRLVGGGSNDTLMGGSGNDAIYGGAGDDYVDPGTGVETLDGGNGLNFLNIDRSATVLGVSFFLNGGVGSDGTTAINFDHMTYTAGSGSDSVVGGANDDLLRGNAGDDTLDGLGGVDFLEGGIGNDVLRGGAGSDQIFGGDGNDRIETGGGGDTQIYGAAGDDTVIGSADAESLFGGGDLDFLMGMAGDDSLFGGSGDDTLSAGTGVNYMDGGTENDVFVFVKQASTDTIAGFDADPAGGQDRLDVSAFNFGNFAGMLAAGVTIVADVTNTVINFGDGAPVLTLTQTAPASIGGADFMF